MTTNGEQKAEGKKTGELVWINGKPFYSSNIAASCAYKLNNKRILAVDSIANPFLFDYNRGLLKSDKPATMYDFFLGSADKIEKITTKSSIENLDFVFGSKSFGIKENISKDGDSTGKFSEKLSELKNSGKYDMIIVNDDDCFNSLQLFNISDRHYIFLSKEKEEINKQISRVNSALLYESKNQLFKNFLSQNEIVNAGQELEKLLEQHSIALLNTTKEQQNGELVESYVSFNKSAKEAISALKSSNKHIENSYLYADVQTRANYLFNEEDGNLNIRKLSLGIGDVVEKKEMKGKMLDLIQSIVLKSKTSLFYLPYDGKLARESINSSRPLIWHAKNESSFLYNQARNFKLTKSLEKITDFIISSNSKNAPQETIKEGDSLFFTGEFLPSRIEKIQNSVENGAGIKSDKNLVNLVKYAKYFNYGGMIFLTGMIGFIGNKCLSQYYNNSLEKESYGQSMNLFSLKAERKQNYAEAHKKIGKLKNIQITVSQESLEKLRKENAAIAARQESARKEAEIKKIKKDAVNYAYKNLEKDLEFLSEVEKINKYTDKFFDVSDVANKKYSIKFDFNKNEIIKVAEKDYVFPLQADEPKKFAELKNKYINKHYKNYIRSHLKQNN